MSFFNFIGVKAKEPQETETIRKITLKLTQLEPRTAKYNALFACILSRVARADLDISEAESRKMEEILITLGHLSPDAAVLVVEIAKIQNILLEGVENFLLTREFLNISTPEERIHLLECLFAVAASDESISTAETNEINQIVNELKLERTDYLAAQAGYREYLKVLKESVSR